MSAGRLSVSPVRASRPRLGEGGVWGSYVAYLNGLEDRVETAESETNTLRLRVSELEGAVRKAKLGLNVLLPAHGSYVEPKKCKAAIQTIHDELVATLHPTPLEPEGKD